MLRLKEDICSRVVTKIVLFVLEGWFPALYTYLKLRLQQLNPRDDLRSSRYFTTIASTFSALGRYSLVITLTPFNLDMIWCVISYKYRYFRLRLESFLNSIGVFFG